MDSTKKIKVPTKDPWTRVEAWRSHPIFSSKANFRYFFPGFAWGVGAFVIACVVEKVFWKPDEHHEHGEPSHWRFELSRMSELWENEMNRRRFKFQNCRIIICIYICTWRKNDWGSLFQLNGLFLCKIYHSESLGVGVRPDCTHCRLTCYLTYCY